MKSTSAVKRSSLLVRIEPQNKIECHSSLFLPLFGLSFLITHNPYIGSAFSISGNVAPILLQLGLYDEFVELGKLATHTYAYKENLKLDFTLDYTDRSTM